MVIWNILRPFSICILWPFGYLVVIWYIFPVFDIVTRKIWQPCLSLLGRWFKYFATRQTRWPEVAFCSHLGPDNNVWPGLKPTKVNHLAYPAFSDFQRKSKKTFIKSQSFNKRVTFVERVQTQLFCSQLEPDNNAWSGCTDTPSSARHCL
jgi:hypothetical protein